MNSRTASERRLGGVAVTDAASKVPPARSYTDKGRAFAARPLPCNGPAKRRSACRLRLDDLVEHGEPVLDGVEPVIRERRVTVLVNGVDAEGRLAVLGVLQQLRP